MKKQLYMLGQHKNDSRGKDNITDMGQDSVPVADRIYVLRFVFPVSNNRMIARRYEYYTGQAPTRRIHEAKTFTLAQAKNTKQFALTASTCEIKRVTRKMLFKSALQGA